MLIIPGAEEAQAAAAAAAEETTNTEESTSTEEVEATELETESESAPDPLETATQELAAEKEQRIRLEERLAGMEARPEAAPVKAEPPKELTRVQLREAVDNGQIDQDQMETLWADQREASTLRKMEERYDARDRERQTTNVIQTDTVKYLDAYPDIRKQGSSDWTRLKSEYDYLISVGDPDNKTTELKAMRSAFGSPDRIRESSASRRQTASETASGQSGGGVGGSRPVDIWNRVPKHLQEPYKKMVADGFKTLEDVKKDIPYMPARPS